MLGAPIKDRAAERRAAIKCEILDAAWEMARESGLSQITLRDLARRIGMQAPSLYSHFASKNAIYDAMFAQAWTECLSVMSAVAKNTLPGRREALGLYARAFFDFAVGDLARFQLMNQRTIVGFEPTQDSYAVAVAVMDLLRDSLAPHGVTRQEDIDLYIALVGGLIDAQLANDPGGDRWGRLLNRTMDMYDDNLNNKPNEGDSYGH